MSNKQIDSLIENFGKPEHTFDSLIGDVIPEKLWWKINIMRTSLTKWHDKYSTTL